MWQAVYFCMISGLYWSRYNNQRRSRESSLQGIKISTTDISVDREIKVVFLSRAQNDSLCRFK